MRRPNLKFLFFSGISGIFGISGISGISVDSNNGSLGFSSRTVKDSNNT